MPKKWTRPPASAGTFSSGSLSRIPSAFSSTAVVLFVVIVLLPVLYMITAPFVAADAASGGYGSFVNSRHLALAQRSLTLGAGTACLSLAIGVPLAFLIRRTDLWGRGFIGVACVIPILIPPYIHAIVWSRMGGLMKPLLDIHSVGGAAWVLALSYFPIVTLITASGLSSMDRSLEEASFLYHGRWHTLRHITLPLLTPHIFSGAVLVLIFSIIDCAAPDILRVIVYPMEIFIQFSALYDERAAMILSLPLIAMTLALLALQKRSMGGRAYVQVSGGRQEAVTYRLGHLNPLAFGFCLLVLGLAVMVPITVLLKMAGPFSSYIAALRTSIGQISYSLILSLLGASVTIFLAFPLAYFIERSNSRAKILLSFAVFIPLAIPAATMGIGLIKVWNRPLADVVYGSSFIIMFGYVARFIPFAVIIIGSGLKQLNPRLEEAAFLATPHGGKVMGRILLPLLKYSLFTAFFIVFILSFGELGMTLLVIPPGRETIPIKIYNLMHYGADETVAALCLILIFIILAFSALLLILHRRLAKRGG